MRFIVVLATDGSNLVGGLYDKAPLIVISLAWPGGCRCNWRLTMMVPSSSNSALTGTGHHFSIAGECTARRPLASSLPRLFTGTIVVVTLANSLLRTSEWHRRPFVPALLASTVAVAITFSLSNRCHSRWET